VEPRTSSPARLYDLPQVGGERVVIAPSAQFDAGTEFSEILLVAGSLHCGAGCRFSRPVYVGGDAEIGRGSQLDAITVEGSLTVGPAAQIGGWAECGGLLDLRSSAVVVGTAISRSGIQLGLDTRVASLEATEIRSYGHAPQLAGSKPGSGYLEILPPSSACPPDLSPVRGWRPERMMPMGDDTWLYDGSLHFPVPLVLRSKLVVRGAFWCPGGSLLEDDIKSGQWLEIGAGSLCNGNLSAIGDLVLDEDCLFSGALRASRDIRLCSGTRGFRESGAVRVSAARRVIFEPNVVVRGVVLAQTGQVTVAHSESTGDLERLQAHA
jgi:hypothetical protein